MRFLNSTKKHHLRLFCFIALTYMGMGMSKFLHPLWFEANDCVEIFAFSYAWMAFVGVFSLLYAIITERLGFHKSMFLGSLLYSSGMALRAIPNSYTAAILSATLAAMGACTVILCLRYWLTQASDGEERTHVLSLKSLAITAGFAIGIALAGQFNNILGTRETLILASTLPLVALVFIRRRKIPLEHFSNENPKPSLKSWWHQMKQHPAITNAIASFSLLSGIYCSLLAPFIPVILKEKGLAITLSSALLATCTIISSMIPLIAKKRIKDRAVLPIYATVEVILAGATGMLILNLSPAYFALIIILRTLVAGIGGICQEWLQLDLIGKNKFFLVGIMQSTFLTGDIIGASLTGYLFKYDLINISILLYSCSLLLNTTLFVLFYLSLKNKPSTAH